MEKMITVPAKVTDLYGLYVELRKSGFAVRNVGMDERGTHVYLEMGESKDPASIVEAWEGKPLPPHTRSLHEQRLKEVKALGLDKPPPPPEEREFHERFTQMRRPSLLSKVFRRIF